MEKYKYTFNDGTVKVMTLDEIESSVISDYKSRGRFTGVTDKTGEDIYEFDTVYRGSVEHKHLLPESMIKQNTYQVVEENGCYVLDTIGVVPFSDSTGLKFVMSAYQSELTLEAS